MLDPGTLVGTHDVLFVTFDTLRYDVAQDAMARGLTPNLAGWLPGRSWEERHSPGNFTFAAHAAFFAGFLPTPVAPGPHPRLFAIRFDGSETTTDSTCVFDAPDIVHGLAQRGYRTICIGGVGFFNEQNELGRVFPRLFHESRWCPEFGVTNPDSTRHQVQYALDRIDELPPNQRLFLFLNLSALHQPNCHYLPGATRDTIESHGAALRYVDGQLPPLVEALRRRAPLLAIFCSDHGTMYGEDGYTGHRVGHPIVYTVPHAEFVLSGLET